MIDHLVGALNMNGQNGEATDQGLWRAGPWQSRPPQLSPREAFLDAVPMGARPALIIEGGVNPDSTSVESVEWAEAIPSPPVSVTEWEVVGTDVEWIDLHYGWRLGQQMHTYTAMGDTLATYVFGGQVVHYNNDILNYWSAPFEVIDRVELARYITPYGINLTLGPDGWAWVFDVTDYAPLLKDSVELQCGNWQELLDLKFAPIGTASKKASLGEKLWRPGLP